jgi:hypothetical protein
MEIKIGKLILDQETLRRITAARVRNSGFSDTACDWCTETCDIATCPPTTDTFNCPGTGL